MSFNAKSYFTTTDMFNNIKNKFQLANFFLGRLHLTEAKPCLVNKNVMTFDRNGLEQLNFLTLSTMAKSIRSGTENNNKTTIPFPNSRLKKIAHVQGVEVGIGFSNVVYQLSFNIFILEALRKFKINIKACMSFKIE